MTYTSFAIIGAGGLGKPILTELIARHKSVVVLARVGSDSVKALAADGVKVVPVDYTDVAAVAAVFKEHRVEVVISTIGYAALSVQKPIGDAAKKAGVKLFSPSEYGFVSEASEVALTAAKNEFAEYLKSIGLPTARFFVGIFTEFIPYITGFSANGKVNVIGKGNVPISFTSDKDIAGFVAHVLTTLSPSELEYKLFRIQGEQKTLAELASLLQTTITYVDAIPGAENDFITLLLVTAEMGHGSTGWDIAAGKEGKEGAGSSNHLWPGHQWRTIRDVLNL